jgi:hypothetical protein
MFLKHTMNVVPLFATFWKVVLDRQQQIHLQVVDYLPFYLFYFIYAPSSSLLPHYYVDLP